MIMGIAFNRLRVQLIQFLAVFLVAVCAIRADAQQGAITLPRNLAELSTMADRVVQGRIVAARVEPHPVYKHLNTVVVTLAIDDALKGASSRPFTFRQFIWDIRDLSNNAGYRSGDEVLLFLNRPTSLELTSPVGLQQGVFRVMKARNGELVAINGNGNSGLLSGAIASGALNTAKLSSKSRSVLQSYRRGPIPLSALKESVRVILHEQVAEQ